MLMGPANNLPYLILHLANVIAKQSDELLKQELGIGLSQYKVLMVLEWNPLIEQKIIAESLGQTEASISRQISNLKAEGLLSSRLDANNKRRHLSVPTARGMQLTEAATALLKRGFSRDFQDIGVQELTNLESSINKLHKNFCQSGKEGACSHQLGF